MRDCRQKSVYMRPKTFGRVFGDVFLDNDGVYFVTANDADEGRTEKLEKFMSLAVAQAQFFNGCEVLVG